MISHQHVGYPVSKLVSHQVIRADQQPLSHHLMSRSVSQWADQEVSMSVVHSEIFLNFFLSIELIN